MFLIVWLNLSKLAQRNRRWSEIQDFIPNFVFQVFVYGNDIYYLDSPSSSEVPKRLTDSGVEHKIFNGVPDWVYQGKVKLKV